MILVFSGTGNSMSVARQLADRLGDRVSVYPDVAEAAGGERVVWVFPVYSWGVPPVVKKWMDAAAPKLGASGRHYAVMTCGDDAGLAGRMWRRLAAGHGWTPAGEFTVIMPNTYVLMKGFDTDPVEIAEAKLAAAPAAVAKIAEAIGRGTDAGDNTVKGRFAWLKTAVIYPWFVRHAMSPRPFHPDGGCVGCGLCARSCPLGNIRMENRRPCWGDNCALCLRCYHVCPHRAVAYGKATRGKSRHTAMLGLLGLKD